MGQPIPQRVAKNDPTRITVNDDQHTCTIDVTICCRGERTPPLLSKNANRLFKQRMPKSRGTHHSQSTTVSGHSARSGRLCKISPEHQERLEESSHVHTHRWAYQKRPTFGVRSSAVKMKPWVARHICSREPCSPNTALQTASSAAVQTSIQKQKVRTTEAKLVPPDLPGNRPEMELSMGTGADCTGEAVSKGVDAGASGIAGTGV